MFYVLPPFVNLLVLLGPFVGFRLYDLWAYWKHPDYQDVRGKYRSYWVYRTAAPRYPSMSFYAVQAVWAVLLLIPFG
jgi:hypothetical protein